MSIQSQINRITGAKNDLATYLDDNGVSIPDGTKIDGMVALLDSVQKGIDTSDADATAYDIAQGKTAYVDGKKVTGSVEVVAEDVNLDAVPQWNAGSNVLYAGFGAYEGRVLFEHGKTITLEISGTKLGDATDADVAEGKTFTSENGLKLTGTRSTAVVSSTISYGTFTMSGDSTTGIYVPHRLGKTPNFAFVMAERDFSSSSTTSALVGAVSFYKAMKLNSSSSSQVNVLHVLMDGYDSTGKSTSYANRYASGNYFSDRNFLAPCNATCMLKNGEKYLWVCGVL